MWKILNTKKIFEHPRLTLLEDEVELPNGHQTDYLKFEHTADGADVIAFNDEGKILLLREYNHPVGEEVWQFPGGFIDENESSKQAANRELAEEAGYSAGNIQRIGHIHIYRRRIAEVSYVHIANNLKKVSHNREVSEFGMSLEWFTEAEIDQLIADGKITASDTLAIWMLYKTKVNTPKNSLN